MSEAAKTERAARREAALDLEPAPDRTERPMRWALPDTSPDPDALKPPALPWQIEGAALLIGRGLRRRAAKLGEPPADNVASHGNAGERGALGWPARTPPPAGPA